jgi:hypothetical protein
MLKDELDKNHEDIDPFLLKCSGILSWDEKQLIDYIRNHPEEKSNITELLQK